MTSAKTTQRGLRLLIEPQQGSGYLKIRDWARYAETLGFAGIFSSDHYMRIGSGLRGVGPCDAWLLLAGLARDVERVRIGSLMSPITFRHPVMLSVMAAQVDQMSGGRVELGIGAGWFPDEHQAMGIALPPVDERMSRLEEALQIITGIWAISDAAPFNYSGDFFSVESWPSLPAPIQRPRPPIIVGGSGKIRTPQLACRYADEFNAPFLGLQGTRNAFEIVKDECDRIDRRSEELVMSASLVLCGGRTRSEVDARVMASGEDLAGVLACGAIGGPSELAEALSSYLEIGAERLYVQVTDASDLGHLEILAEAAQLAGI